VGVTRDFPNFLITPYLLSQERISYELQIWQVYSQGPSEQKPLKNGRKGSVGDWAYPGTAQIFSVPPVRPISGTHKAANFKFGRYIHSVHPNKSPLKISEKGSVGVSRGWPNFLSTRPIISITGKSTNF